MSITLPPQLEMYGAMAPAETAGSDVFLQAAERIADGLDYYSCTAIIAITRSFVSPEAQWYREIFRGSSEHLVVCDVAYSDLDPVHFRVMLLCMAAAVAESGGL